MKDPDGRDINIFQVEDKSSCGELGEEFFFYKGENSCRGTYFKNKKSVFMQRTNIS